MSGYILQTNVKAYNEVHNVKQYAIARRACATLHRHTVSVFPQLQGNVIELTTVTRAMSFLIAQGDDRFNDRFLHNTAVLVSSFDTSQWRCASEIRHAGHACPDAILLGYA